MLETWIENGEEPGRRLRRVRELLRLKYRDVEEASHEIARTRKNQEFAVGLSRLADIENRGTTPSLYRLYSLCAIYGLHFRKVLAWYGIDLGDLAADSVKLSTRETHPLDSVTGEIPKLDINSGSGNIEKRDTSILKYTRSEWHTVFLSTLTSSSSKHLRFGVIGEDDWYMYPILPPGCYIQIDEDRRRIAADGWTTEHNRPIYLIEHRTGYRCGWCTEKNGTLIVQPHTSSRQSVELFKLPEEAEVLGQITAVFKRLGSDLKHHKRF